MLGDSDQVKKVLYLFSVINILQHRELSSVLCDDLDGWDGGP